MRNVWKGLTVGAFAGAAVGITLDAFRKTADMSVRAAEGVSTRAKSGAGHLADLVEEKIDDWDVEDKIETAKDGVKEGVEHAIDTGKHAIDAGKKAMSRK